MASYVIKERPAGCLSGGTGLSGLPQIEYLLYRDGLLVGPYDSRDEAERAIGRLQQADEKETERSV